MARTRTKTKRTVSRVKSMTPRAGVKGGGAKLCNGGKLKKK